MSRLHSTGRPSVAQRRRARRAVRGNRKRKNCVPSAALPVPFAGVCQHSCTSQQAARAEAVRLAGVVLNPVVLTAAWAFGAFRQAACSDSTPALACKM